MLKKFFAILLLSTIIFVSVPMELHLIFTHHQTDQHCKIPSHSHFSELHHHCSLCHFEIPFFNFNSTLSSLKLSLKILTVNQLIFNGFYLFMKIAIRLGDLQFVKLHHHLQQTI